MILLHLNRDSQLALHRQVFHQPEDLINSGTIPPGSKLPPTRVLAEKHGLSRATVMRAYEELWALGYTESRPGSYSYVRQKTPNIKMEQRAQQRLIDWQQITSGMSQLLLDDFERTELSSFEQEKTDMIDMHSFNLDGDLYPTDDFRRCLNWVLTEHHEQVFGYGQADGYAPLRSFIATRLQSHGTFISPDEVLITNGTQNSLDLLFRLLTMPGSRIVIERPTYFHLLPLARYYQVELSEIDMEADGLNLSQLEHVLATARPAFIYTMPNFQNPTGITMSQEKREKLLSLCETHRVPIIEDAFEEEMKYFGKVALPIKSMDKNQLVIYLGSFSKVLFPGLRIGWIAADVECIRRLTALKKFSDLSSSYLLQVALHEFCRRKYYDLHLQRMHRVYRKRMQVMVHELRVQISFANVTWNEPLGGYLIWLQLTDTGITEDELMQLLRVHGLRVMPGNRSQVPGSAFPVGVLGMVSQNMFYA